MNSKPILSICIPTYNRAKIVYKCVKHILKYQGDEIEVIVSNNASTDNTLELLASICDPRLKINTNDKNIYCQNWTKVVFMAKGAFAALMSDEDEVCIENLDYFITLLKSSDAQQHGAIIYSYPPVRFMPCTYSINNVYEVISTANKLGIHITGTIVNKDAFNIIYDKVNLETAPDRQLQMVIGCAAEKQSLMLTDTPLCRYVVPEQNTKAVTNDVYINPEFYGGRAPDYRLKMAAFVYGLVSRHLDDSENSKLTVLSIILARQREVAGFFLKVAAKGEHPEIKHLDVIRKTLNYTIHDVNREMAAFFNACMDFVNGKISSIEWELLNKLVYSMIYAEYECEIPPGIPKTMRILVGDYAANYIFMAKRYLNINLLGADETSKMHEYLSAKNYNAVIDFPDVETHRALFHKGKAYFMINDYINAEICFKKFLEKALEPKKIKDVIVVAESIIHALYFLGLISEKHGNANEAAVYFAESKELADSLLMGLSVSERYLSKVVFARS